MSIRRLAGTASAALLLTAAGIGHAQLGPAPTDAKTSEEPVSGTDVVPPAEQFAACADITSRAERAKCIERQTAKGNPATRSAADAPAPKSEKSPK